jgi:hypothetical protein
MIGVPLTTSTVPGGIADSVRRADAAQAEFRLCHGPQPRPWVPCTSLLTPTAVADWATRVATWLRAEYGEAPDRTVAGYLVSWYLTIPARAGALLFRTARRVPRIGPAALAVRFDGARPAGIAVLDDRFACLADDPAAQLPEATPVPDETVLAAVLRGWYAAHAARFLAVVPRALNVRLGRRTLWAMATDTLDGACWRIGQALGQEDAGVADARLVLPVARHPFTAASTMRPDSAGEWTRSRGSCCFHYVLTTGMGPCATCPRVCDQ